jgi:hypothetical protein
MAVSLVALIAVVLFLVVLAAGRAQISKGANAHVANGAVLLALGVVLGVFALGVVVSLDTW